MCAFISFILMGVYFFSSKPELIVAAALFAIGAEISVLMDKFIDTEEV